MNIGDYDGRTALHLAAAEGHLRCVRFLLETCKVQHDVKDRWGQTPISEAILFKHTKVAALLKRHERTKAKKSGEQGAGGEALWRRMVEKKMMTSEEEKEKKRPLFKFQKNLVKKSSVGSNEQIGNLIKDLENRTRIDSSTSSGLDPLNEDEEESEATQMNKAALFIQSKFRDFQKRKSISSEGTNGTSGAPISPNGFTNGSDSGVSVQ